MRKLRLVSLLLPYSERNTYRGYAERASQNLPSSSVYHPALVTARAQFRAIRLKRHTGGLVVWLDQCRDIPRRQQSES